MENGKKKKIILGVIVGVLVLTLAGTFALWAYSKIGQNQLLVAGDIYMKYTGTNTMNVQNVIPTDTYNKTDYFEFTVEGKNNYSKDIIYDIVLDHGDEPTGEGNENRNVRIDDKFLNFRLVKVTGEDSEEEVIQEGNYENIIQKKIWVDRISANTTDETSTKYRLYVWISSEIKIGNTEDADYEMDTWNNNVFASIKVTITGDFEDKKLDGETELLLDTIRSKLDISNSVTDEEDGTIYFSGTNDEINFNYVWYSGKLWRITAINPDNTIKMITQNEITAIAWNKSGNTTYEGSWIYQWLNEDFLDTLENQENIIVQNAKWNATEIIYSDGKYQRLKETIIVNGNVGLLNAYEYTQAYKNVTAETNYLNIGYNWWLITPHINSNVRYVGFTGILGNYSSPSVSCALGVRPSVNLKSDIKLRGGEGTKENPYRIEGDKKVAQVNDKLNSRVSGEYVNFDGRKYRIVGIENDTTKLTSVDYVRYADGTMIYKHYTNWATSVTSGSDGYWGYYLDNAWYNSINLTYQIMMTSGTYYLGQYGASVSYKNTICSSSNTTEKTKECSKTSSWTGYVGLPRVGEMFSAQLGEGESSSSNMWLITPYDSSSGRYVYNSGDLSYSDSSSYGVRPSINLKSDVVITSGDGTEQSPYEIKYIAPFEANTLKKTLGTKGGIIGIKSDNTKTTSPDDEVREYRYSGVGANNYVYFNCSDSTSEQNSSNCETWRIIGIFKDESGNEHMKIVRNSTSTTRAWNSNKSSSWTSSSVRTYLNGSFLTSLTSKAQNMIYEEAKWYLGAVTYNDTTVNLYTQERKGSIWSGKIGLMYPSDYGYSGSYWYTKTYSEFTSKELETSWLYKTSNHNTSSGAEWFISPSTSKVAIWEPDGRVYNYDASSTLRVRPALYLKSEVEIIEGGNGSSGSPYQLSCSNCTASS